MATVRSILIGGPWTIVDSISRGQSDGTYATPESDGMDRSDTAFALTDTD